MRRIPSVLFLAAVLTAAPARAGVTIHYEGAVASDAERAAVVADATAFAKAKGWTVEPGKDGVVLRPHAACEPLELLFEGRRLQASFVKTQFAGPEIHIAIVELFRSVQKRFQKLAISDEGEYWDGSDREKLIERMQSDGLMMVRLQQRQPGARGPFVIPGGRIVDLMDAPPGADAGLEAGGTRPLDAPFVTPRPWRPEAKPLPAIPADRWTRFEAKDERFEVSFPGAPDRKPLDSGVRFRATVGGAAFTVMAVKPVEGADAAATLADLPPALAQRYVGKILADRTDVQDGRAVRTMTVIEDGTVLHLRIVVAGNRPFLLRASAEKAAIPEGDVRTFFDSFRVSR